MKIPVSRGRVEPQAQMQTFTPNQNVLTGRPMDLTYQTNGEKAVKGTPSETEYNFYTKQSQRFFEVPEANAT